MPTLTRDEVRVLAGLRRLLVAFAGRLPQSAEPEPAGLSLILKELKLMSETFNTAMSKLSGDVAAQSTIIASATQAFRGLVAQLVAAEAAAKNAGASDAQVASVTQLRQQLEANTASLAAAIPANTEQAPSTTATPITPVTPVETTDPTVSATSSVPASAPAPSAQMEPSTETAAPVSTEAAAVVSTGG